MQQMHLDWWARVAQASRRTIRLLTHPSIPVGSPLVPHHEFRTLLLALYTAAAEYDVPIEEVQKAGAVVYEEKKKGIEEQKKRAEEANRAVKAAEEPKAEVVAP